MHQILPIFWLSLFSTIHANKFNILHHLGANSPWFAGPNINNIPPTIPDECTVDQAIYIVRHGSRYPDPGASEEWEDLYKLASACFLLFQSSTYNASGSLSFLPSWRPVLRYPDEEIGQVSLTGYKELYNLGVDLRFRYPTFYRGNSPFLLWANNYPRTIDSARLLALGYTGPNTTLSTIYTINSTAPASKSNSLAPSDQCPNFSDSSGGDHTSTWDDIYLPPITQRLNELISGGNLTLTDAQVALFPYLCAFETQITGRRSPWCEVFTEDEVRQYEYRQDLRYYYGTGPGAGKNMTTMFPILQGIVNLLQGGPTATATAKVDNNNTTTEIQLPPLIVAFTHDNQINELASILGVFDRQEPLSADGIDEERACSIQFYFLRAG
ncbi:hypothetical protein MW887_011351 [Aspergillus wentii]|nr:hypothetical protein MW887_011351 [Aspergillus wentii]